MYTTYLLARKNFVEKRREYCCGCVCILKRDGATSRRYTIHTIIEYMRKTWCICIKYIKGWGDVMYKAEASGYGSVVDWLLLPPGPGIVFTRTHTKTHTYKANEGGFCMLALYYRIITFLLASHTHAPCYNNLVWECTDCRAYNALVFY